MTSSKLIELIIKKAEPKFKIDSYHINDSIQVGMYHYPGSWQVWIQKPTKEQLDKGQIRDYDNTFAKDCVYDTFLFTKSDSLIGALMSLHEKVQNY